MRTGLWMPVSSNTLGIAFLIAIIGIIIYAFYYNSKRGAIKKLEQSFNSSNGNNHSRVNNIRIALNIPDSADGYFKNKKIDFSANTLMYFTDGQFGFALGSHKGLRVPKVFFVLIFQTTLLYISSIS